MSATLAVLGLVAALCAPLCAFAQGQLRFGAGLEYTSGDYGGTEDIDDLYVPLTMIYGLRRTNLFVTVPYLEVETSSGETASGLGDVIAGLTVYDVFRSADGSLALDFTGKIKFGTADETVGLGSGQNDYSVQVGLYKSLAGGGFSSGVGYKVRGDPGIIDLENVWFTYIGGFRAFSPRTSGGLFFDYREASLAGNDAVEELSASISHRTKSRWRLYLYVIKGLSDSSPDWGGGFSAWSAF